MIAYDLQCANGHTFEGWFEDGQAYEAQKQGASSVVLFVMIFLYLKSLQPLQLNLHISRKNLPPNRSILQNSERKSSILWRKISTMSVVILLKRPLKFIMGFLRPEISGATAPNRKKNLKR